MLCAFPLFAAGAIVSRKTQVASQRALRNFGPKKEVSAPAALLPRSKRQQRASYQRKTQQRGLSAARSDSPSHGREGF